jgi:hypothetical protein
MEGIRRFIHITLIHVDRFDRSHVTFDVILERIQSVMTVDALIIGTEYHSEDGKHYHIGVLNHTLAKRNYVRRIRNVFPEFDGRAIDVKAHKAWSTVVSYASKEDEDPFLFGDITMDQVNMHRKHRKARDSGLGVSKNLLLAQEAMWNASDHHELARNPYLFGRMLQNYNSVVRLYDTVQTLKRREQKLIGPDRLKELSLFAGDSKAYNAEEIGQARMDILEWFSKNLFKHRAFKQAQLLILGESNTLKTTSVLILKEAGIDIYEVPKDTRNFRFEDWVKSDVWFMDEFRVTSFDLDSLFKMLAGNSVVLRGAYEKSGHVRDTNGPIVLAAMHEPQFETLQDKTAFYNRVKVVRLEKTDIQLDAKRYVKTILELREAYQEAYQEGYGAIMLSDVPTEP